MAILKRGLAGEPVKRLQEKLGIEADGQFGPKTEEALNPIPFAHMGLHELVLLKTGTGTSGEAHRARWRR